MDNSPKYSPENDQAKARVARYWELPQSPDKDFVPSIGRELSEHAIDYLDDESLRRALHLQLQLRTMSIIPTVDANGRLISTHRFFRHRGP